MKEIKAIIQPIILEKVLEALHGVERLPGCAVSQVRAYARSGAHGPDGGDLGFTEMMKLEMVVPDKDVAEVVEAVRAAAHTGHKGDGKIFVIGCADAVNICSGKSGDEGL